MLAETGKAVQTAPKRWLCSDHHFGHANILTFKNDKGDPVRPGFSDVTHMDETMIARHNLTVGDRDKVHFLGDVGMSRKHLEKILPRLKGRKRLVLGNHDTLPVEFYAEHFEEVLAWRQFKEGDITLFCSHFPLHTSAFVLRGKQGGPGARINVHGHIHERTIRDPRYINVCVEHTDYFPVPYETILKRAQTQSDLAQKTTQKESAR